MKKELTIFQAALIASIFAIFVSATVNAVITIVEEKSPQEETITIDKKRFINIYQYAYVRGRMSEIQCNSKEDFKLLWQKDSAEIFEMYFKKEMK